MNWKNKFSVVITVTYGYIRHTRTQLHMANRDKNTDKSRKKTIPKLSLSVEYSNDFDVDLWLAIGA